MKVVITDIHPEDAHYHHRHLLIGMVGELGDVNIEHRKGGWAAFDLYANRLYLALVGLEDRRPEVPFSFYKARYRKGE